MTSRNNLGVGFFLAWKILTWFNPVNVDVSDGLLQGLSIKTFLKLLILRPKNADFSLIEKFSE